MMEVKLKKQEIQKSVSWKENLSFKIIITL